MLGFPDSESDLTAAWFTTALAPRFPGVQVRTADLLTKIGGTAAKFRFRLTYAADVGAPQTLWVKGGFETGGADQGEAFANEVRFYRDLAPKLGINLPQSYFGEVDSVTSNGVVLLEDLLNRPSTFGRASDPLSPDQAWGALEMQASYHAQFWNARELADLGWLKPGGSIAGSGMVQQYFAGFWDSSRALERFRWVSPGLDDKARVESALVKMIDADARDAHCLVHGDSHCANLFFDPDGSPGYLDWQHVMRGHWAFDVTNLLVTGLTVADRRAHERALVARYRDRLLELGAAAPSFDVMWDDYRRHAAWSFMWVMCPVSAHPEDVCTLNAERACAAMADLDTLALLDDA